MHAVLQPVPAHMHPDEWPARLQLASCYPVLAMTGWSGLSISHIPLVLPDMAPAGGKNWFVKP